MLRHGELLVLPPRGFEPGERITILHAREMQQRHRAVDHGLQHLETVRASAHPSSREDAQCFVEVAHRRECIGHVDVG